MNRAKVGGQPAGILIAGGTVADVSPNLEDSSLRDGGARPAGTSSCGLQRAEIWRTRIPEPVRRVGREPNGRNQMQLHDKSRVCRGDSDGERSAYRLARRAKARSPKMPWMFLLAGLVLTCSPGQHPAAPGTVSFGAAPLPSAAKLRAGTVVQLTADAGHYVQPVWSPDGQWIAFSRAGFGSIEVMRADGTGRRLLVQAPRAGYRFAWSHQRLLDGAFGNNGYRAIMVCFAETKLDSRSLEVVEICVLNNGWRISRCWRGWSASTISTCRRATRLFRGNFPRSSQ